jgi:hypothetical protein
MKFDLRADRRLHLKRPAAGLLLGAPVEIHDLGIRSIGIELETELTPGTRAYLEFSWTGTVIRLSCRVASTRRAKYREGWCRSGLVIERDSESRDEYLRRVEAALEQLRAAEAKLPPLL